jgi:hypothetical protein
MTYKYFIRDFKPCCQRNDRRSPKISIDYPLQIHIQCEFFVELDSPSIEEGHFRHVAQFLGMLNLLKEKGKKSNLGIEALQARQKRTVRGEAKSQKT